MASRGAVALWLLLLGTGCAAARPARLDTGRGHALVFTLRPGDVEPVELDEDAFKEALEGLARDVRPSAQPLEEARRQFRIPSVRAYPAATGPTWRPGADTELTQAYLRWCERKSRPGDCLRLLEGGSTLTHEGRYALAMALAMDSVWEETAEALKDMVSPEAVLATLVSAGTMYCMLWVLPEPLSKGLAATLTVALAAYLGVDTVWGLIRGWVRLVEEVDRAVSFAELRAAGEKYGEVMGKNAARIFVLLTTAAVGRTGAQLAERLPSLPGAGQAAKLLQAEAGMLYESLAGVQSVALQAENVVISLAPGAVAMATRGMSGGSAPPSSTRVSGADLAKLRREFEALKSRFWKNEASVNEGAYSSENLAKLRKGKPPIGPDGHPMELHHKVPLAEGGTNSLDNLKIMTRTEHRLGSSYKQNHPNLP